MLEAKYEIDEKAKSLVDYQEGIYLSGPIRKVSDDGHGWRNQLIADYKDQYKFLNPLDNHDPEEVDILANPIDLDLNSDREQILPCQYVFDDKLMIQKSQFVFVGLPDEIARGTCMEMMFAFVNKTPFFVWTIDGQEESGWIFDHAEIVSDDRDDVMKAIKNYEQF